MGVLLTMRKTAWPASNSFSGGVSGTRTAWPSLGWDEMPSQQDLQTPQLQGPCKSFGCQSRCSCQIRKPASPGVAQSWLKRKKNIPRISQKSKKTLEIKFLHHYQDTYQALNLKSMHFRVECIFFLLLWMTLQGPVWVWGYLSTVMINHFSLIF